MQHVQHRAKVKVKPLQVDLEAERRTEETRYRVIAELTADLAYETRVDADGASRIVWLTGQVQSVLGYSQEEVAALRGLEAVALPEDLDILAAHRAAVLEGGVHEVEFRICTKSGEVRWLRERARALHATWTDGAQGILGTLHDITAQKQDDQAMRLTQLSVDHAADAILWVDEEGRYTYANEAACRMLGYGADELMALYVYNIDPNLSKRIWPQRWNNIKRQGSISITTTHRTHRGQVIPVEMTTTYVDYLGHGHCFQFVRDITEQKKHEDELVRARQEAEEMSNLKSAFLENMSHEIRTPLAAIIGFASILIEEVPKKHQRFIKFIERSGKRLLETLNSILNLSMLESGSVKLNREVLNIMYEVQEKVQMLKPLAEEKGITLDVVEPDEEVQAFLDRVCLDRVLTNLVSNAIKFTEEGRIVLEVRGHQDRVDIAIRDTGVGISEEFLPHLFSDFKQETMGRTRSYEGIGLGLAITKRMVDLMGGEITVQSVKGEGSSFLVSFPQLVIHRKTEKGTLTVAPSDGLFRERRPRILAVEDNPDMLVLLKHYLGRQYDVVTAADEETALDLAGKHVYDLVMMDINLGRARTGLDVLDDLRKVGGYADAPVVAVTAYALPGDRERFIAAGFDGYIGKPFTRKQLYMVLDDVLTG